MQNRFVGDIGDFGKYGLLRALCKGRRLGIVWYLVPDEHHNNDGGLIDYPNRASCDPELYATLQRILREENRNIGAIRKAGILPTKTFYEIPLTFERVPIVERGAYRRSWLKAASEYVRDCDVLFLDPDNGLQVKSKGPGSAQAQKYVFWEDFSFYQPEQSLIIYQQRWQRTAYEKLAKQQIDQLHTIFKCRDIYALSYSPDRIFYVIPVKGDSLLSEKVRSFLNDDYWKQYFTLVASIRGE